MIKKGRIYMNDNIDIKDNNMHLMMINMKEAAEYYNNSKRLLNRSFILFSVMSVAGFIVLTYSIFIILEKNLDFANSIVPVIGGSIIELISATFMILYTKSLKQVNKHYRSVQNDSRLLMMINLVKQLSDSKKDDVYISIINSQIESLKKHQ